MKKQISAGLVSAAMLATAFAVFPTGTALTASAAVSYPVQYFRLGMADTDANVNASGASLAPGDQNGTNAEKWSLNWISDGVFEIVSADSGLILTVNGSGVSLAKDTDAAGQRWKIEGVKKDFDGYYLYYKITSNADSSKALTFTEGVGFSLAAYSGGTYQQYKLNLDGCEGWAANAKTSSGEKACTIGGLLGEVVYVSTADDLEKQLNSVGAQTIVITGDIDMQTKGNTRIRDNKTIVGCYGNHTIYDSQFRTNDAWGAADDSPSDNIVFRNLKMVAKNVPNRILINVWSSRQIWIDHIFFDNQLSYDRTGNGQDEVGKFIWINTPYDNYRDAKDRLRSPDYVTISYCHLKKRYWTVAYGTQNDEITRDRTTLLYNWWDENVRRCPQLGNGSAHIYNNYYSAFGKSGNGGGTSGIIGGDGSDMVSENNYFNGYTLQQALMMGGGSDPCRDSGSYLSEALNGTPSKVSFSPKTASTWYPNKSNYGYSLLDAYNTKNTDTKAFCTKYAGDQTSAGNMQYITNAAFASWLTAKYDSPFLRHVDFAAVTAASFPSGWTYRLKNVNSGLYMQVEGAKAENGTNVQQWGTADGTVHDIWKLIDEGDGYYSIISAVGDGGTYALDIAGKKTANGTNADIYQYNGGDNQKFMLTKNADGSYKLRTKITNGKSAVEIANAGTGSGDNVQQWEINGANCQDWILEAVANPGCKMDTNVSYEFENVNSGMVMDIEAGKMEGGTNVQQWTTGHFNSQKWVLEAFSGGGNYYYIRSFADQGYVLRAASGSNGGNLEIAPYSTKDSAMLFKFSKQPDGSYTILTRASKDGCLVEIPNAGTGSGNNVAQWEPTGHACQRWKAVTEPLPEPTEPPTEVPTMSEDATEPASLRGDVDANGTLEVLDLVKLTRFLHALDHLDAQQSELADLDTDGCIDVFDLGLLKRLLADE
ncbi:MAG: RICIN domain-containing protein [Oscillospiraceae bacterium]|nr:RICIN domain-containing protein [Oscillospiraceae bacterium]